MSSSNLGAWRVEMATMKSPLLAAAGAVDGTPTSNVANKDKSAGENVKNELGTFYGVFLPCILCIFGAIVFVRLPWSVGEGGILGGLLTFFVAGIIILLTVLSIAAISTNGTIGGGGAYYMISRVLGPEFGGAVGLVFFAANAVGISFYLIAFAGEVESFTGGGHWYIVLYSSGSLLFLLGCTLIGAKFFSRLNLLIFACLMISIVVSFISFLASHRSPKGYTGPSFETLKDNLWVQYSESDGSQMSFFKVMIVIFPAMTGVLAGANLSGDLKDPGKSIGKGTLMAIFFALSIYMCLIVVIGATVDRATLQSNYYIMQQVCFSEAFVAMGLVASTLSSALGNLASSGRILQALARDNLFPFLKPFSWGSKNGDEPYRGILLAWVIAQGCLFLGQLDTVASLISQFFLLVYMFTNIACFALAITGAPNFRPSFKYFSWHTALAGAIGCAVVLFMSGPLTASISVLVLVIAWLYIHYTSPASEWGDITQALIYHQVRKYLLRLDERKAHAKFWRPSVLLLVQDPSSNQAQILIDFCNNLKKGGLYVLGSVLPGPVSITRRQLPLLRAHWLEFIEHFGIKAFVEVGVGRDVRCAYQNLFVGAGIGGMKPNTVCLPFFQPTALHESLEKCGISLKESKMSVDRSVAQHVESTQLVQYAATLRKSKASALPLHLGSGLSFAIQVALGIGPAAQAALGMMMTRPSPNEILPEYPALTDEITRARHTPEDDDQSIDEPSSLADNNSVDSHHLDEHDESTSVVRPTPEVQISINGDESTTTPMKRIRAGFAGQTQKSLRTRSARAGAAAANIRSVYDTHSITDTSTERDPEEGQTSIGTSKSLLREGVALPVQSLEQYLQLARDALGLQRNVIVTRWFDILDKDLIVAYKEAASQRKTVHADASQLRVDVWLTEACDFSPESASSLCVQLAHILRRTDIWSSSTSLRVVSIVRSEQFIAAERARIVDVLQQFRFSADVRIIPLHDSRARPTLAAVETYNAGVEPECRIDAIQHPAVLNEVIRHHSENTCVVFLPFPRLPPRGTLSRLAGIQMHHGASARGNSNQECSDTNLSKMSIPIPFDAERAVWVGADTAFAYDLDVLTQGLPPTVLVSSASATAIMTTDL